MLIYICLLICVALGLCVSPFLPKNMGVCVCVQLVYRFDSFILSTVFLLVYLKTII